MNKLLSGGLLAVFVASCGSDPPPGAAVAKDVTLPDSPLAQVQNLSLMRAGDSFTLAGYDGAQVQWGRLSVDGVLTSQASFPLAKPAKGPFFAATKKVGPGDQLIAITVNNSTTVIGGFDLIAIPHTVGDAAPGASVVLASLPAGTDLATVQVAAGAAASGNTGYVAWGIRITGIPVSYLLLPADAITAATPSVFMGMPVPADVPAWDCLASQNRGTGLSFSAVTPSSGGATSDFQTVEIEENGDTTFMTYPLTAAVVDCRIVGIPANAGSYFMALKGVQNGGTAIDFATYYPKTQPAQGDGTVTTHHPTLAAANFGDPINMPYPAWVASAGGDVVIGLARKSGPQIVRFTYNAVPHGSSLTLRSRNGQTGPVAAWVGDDAAYVTYTDLVTSGGATSVKRYFMRIVSPAQLP